MRLMRLIEHAFCALLVVANSTAGAKEIVVAVPGIPGPYCAYGAEKRLRELAGVLDVRTSWRDEQIVVTVRDANRVGVDDIKRAMERADYPYKFEIRMTAE
jgi:copper chaperone CopZ